MLTSIRTALAVMFSVLAIVTGLQGWFTYRQLVQAEADVHSVAEYQLPSLSAIRDIANAVLRVRSKQFRLVLSEPDEQVIANNATELQADLDDLQAARARYGGLIATEPERKIYGYIAISLDNYTRMTSPLVGMMRAGQVEQARSLLLQPWLRVLFQTTDSQLRNAVTLNHKRAHTHSVASVVALTHAKAVALISAVVAACLALAAVAVSYWRIIKPLAAVTHTLNQLAQGDIAARAVFSRRRDEIGAIGRAVEVFRSSLLRARQAEVERLETQLLVQNIAASTPDGVVAFDDRGCVTFWNHAAEDLFGLRADEVLGTSIDQVLTTGIVEHDAETHEPITDRQGRTVETEVRHRDGRTIPVELSLSHWRQDGRLMSCAILRDIRDRKRDEAVLHHLAHTDGLTGLPNRSALTFRIAQALDEDRRFAVLMFDLDHFKEVNDVFGHQTGDGILKIAAQRLLACIGPHDMVARVGGDEFILLLDGQADPLAVAGVAEAMVQALGDPFAVEGRSIHLGASIGIALAPSHGHDADELMTCADLALYAVKSQGRHSYRVFTPDLRGAAVRDSRCRQELPRAIERGEFKLFYQPQVRLTDGALIGAEALIRWQHPEFGLIAPDAFIPVLESSHLAEEVGVWVIRTACQQAAEWRQRWPDFRVGVNLSGAHFRSGRLGDTIRQILAASGLPGSALEVEITENVILRHDEKLIGPLRDVQAQGVSIAFDDYGTGYASLSLLKRFPLNRLKIDRSFVRTMEESAEDAAIIRTILALGYSLGLGVIAEGVETERQADWLSRHGCLEAQGYLFGRPMPPALFETSFATALVATRRAG